MDFLKGLFTGEIFQWIALIAPIYLIIKGATNKITKTMKEYAEAKAVWDDLLVKYNEYKKDGLTPEEIEDLTKLLTKLIEEGKDVFEAGKELAKELEKLKDLKK